MEPAFKFSNYKLTCEPFVYRGNNAFKVLSDWVTVCLRGVILLLMNALLLNIASAAVPSVEILSPAENETITTTSLSTIVDIKVKSQTAIASGTSVELYLKVDGRDEFYVDEVGAGTVHKTIELVASGGLRPGSHSVRARIHIVEPTGASGDEFDTVNFTINRIAASVDVAIMRPEDGSIESGDVPVNGTVTFTKDSTDTARLTLTMRREDGQVQAKDQVMSVSPYTIDGVTFNLEEFKNYTLAAVATIRDDLGAGEVARDDSNVVNFRVESSTGLEEAPPDTEAEASITSLIPVDGSTFVNQSLVNISATADFSVIPAGVARGELAILVDDAAEYVGSSQDLPLSGDVLINLSPGKHVVSALVSVLDRDGRVLAADSMESEITVVLPIVTLEFNSEADSYVRTDLDVRRNDNYGRQEFIAVGTGRGGNGKPFGAADAIRGLVRFDTSFMPHIQLNDAVLELTLHSFDGFPTSVFTVDVHRLLGTWIEGNGFEGPGSRGGASGGGPVDSVDPDSAFGVAWAGAGDNPDINADNNQSQPHFDMQVAASVNLIYGVFSQSPAGAAVQWDITSLVQDWLNESTSNFGLLLRDVTTDGGFRGVRFGSREGNLFMLPGAVDEPRLMLSWTSGSIPGDLSGDNCVDRGDLNIVLSVVRGKATPGPNLNLDFNADGDVNIADARALVLLFTNPRGLPCQ